MRLVGRIAVTLVVACAITAMAPGCQEPTEVTVDVKLVTAQCSEVHGVAIVVGNRPEEAEERVKTKFPTAQTTECDPATSEIGTLVLMPADDSDTGAIIVTAGYADINDPTNCQPPDYRNCIVARRRFSFVKHKRLTVPIEIDPTCVNVPCDAFSTCRKGRCYDAEIDPCETPGASCPTPGLLSDGAADPHPTDDSGPFTPSEDGAVISSTPKAICEGGMLVCAGKPCNGVCCFSPETAYCDTRPNATCTMPARRACCSSLDCGGTGCMHSNLRVNTSGCVGTETDGAPCPTPEAGADGSMTMPDGGDGGDGGDGAPPFDGSVVPPDGGGDAGDLGLGFCLQ